MSYILEALKKSDEERKKAEPPVIDEVYKAKATSPRKAGQERRRRPMGISPIIMLVLFSGIMLTLGYYIAKKAHPETPETPMKATDIATEMVQKQYIESSPQKNLLPKESLQPKVLISASTKDQPTLQELEPPPQQRKNLARKRTQANKQDTLPQLEDLPPDIQSQLPDLSFAGHAYAAIPSQRLIIINSKILREGERIHPHLRLQKITKNGIILNYKSHTFEIRLTNW